MNKICDIFNEEVILYHFNELDSERRAFWNNHLNECEVCSKELSEIEKTFELVAEEASFDITDDKFNDILKNVTSFKQNKGLSFNFSGIRVKEFIPKLSYGLAFSFIIITAAVTMYSRLTNIEKISNLADVKQAIEEGIDKTVKDTAVKKADKKKTNYVRKAKSNIASKYIDWEGKAFKKEIKSIRSELLACSSEPQGIDESLDELNSAVDKISNQINLTGK